MPLEPTRARPNTFLWGSTRGARRLDSRKTREDPDEIAEVLCLGLSEDVTNLRAYRRETHPPFRRNFFGTVAPYQRPRQGGLSPRQAIDGPEKLTGNLVSRSVLEEDKYQVLQIANQLREWRHDSNQGVFAAGTSESEGSSRPASGGIGDHCPQPSVFRSVTSTETARPEPHRRISPVEAPRSVVDEYDIAPAPHDDDAERELFKHAESGAQFQIEKALSVLRIPRPPTIRNSGGAFTAFDSVRNPVRRNVAIQTWMSRGPRKFDPPTVFM